MPTIYISDRGDDKNDGLSLKTPIYSLKQAQKLQGGGSDYSWHFGPRAWKRIKKELADEDQKRRRRSVLGSVLAIGVATACLIALFLFIGFGGFGFVD
jgi:hypothetical protein